MKKAIKLVTALILCAALLCPMQTAAVSQQEIDELEQQREQIQQRQDDMQEYLDQLEQSHDSLLEQKEALDEQSELLRQDIELLEKQIALYETIVAESKAQAEQAQADQEKQYGLYCSQLRLMEEHSGWSYMSFVLGSDSLAQLLSRLNDIFDLLSYDHDLWKEYVSAREEADRAMEQYSQELEQQKAKQLQLEAQQASLQEKIASSARLLEQLEQDMDAYLEYLDAVDGEMADVQALIDEKAAQLWQQQQSASGQTGESGPISSGYYAWPSYCGIITSPFGPRTHPIYGQLKPHTGVDIGAQYGTAVTAAASGTVTLAVLDYGSVGYGTYVAIYHSNGSTTLYAHMSALCVSPGQYVEKGQVIGYVGSTGASTGPHLHFEIRVNGACVDPMQYF